MPRNPLKYYLLVFGVVWALSGKAQWVNIPDSNFAAYLHSQMVGVCMSGNLLDTTCSEVLTVRDLEPSYYGIHDLTGIQYFKNLRQLLCYNDSLTQLPTLPMTLTNLDCSRNKITSLPTFLPPNLDTLVCDVNNLDSLPVLPSTLVLLSISDNYIVHLPVLPSALSQLRCGYNPALLLDTLPQGLNELDCPNCGLTNLPTLPLNLKTLYCSNNNLRVLPTLTDSLHSLSCAGNQLTYLPPLPPKLYYISCDHNFLTEIPVLPDSMYMFSCFGNSTLSCLPALKRIYNLYFGATAVSCISDYGHVTYSSPALSSLPRCDVFNPAGCNTYWNIHGNCFYNGNHNCIYEGTQPAIERTKLLLYSGNVLLQQVFSKPNGDYSFSAVQGNYYIRPDTTDFSFLLSCPNSGYLNVFISASDSVSFGNNLGFDCNTQIFDAFVNSILKEESFNRPGEIFKLKIVAGELSSFYRATCLSNANLTGTVKLVFSSLAHFLRVDSSALSPSNINGDTITWNVSDFSLINPYTSFNCIFQIDSQAPAHSHICFQVEVSSSVSGTVNHGTHSLESCIEVHTPHDPNEKEVYPFDNIDTSAQWLTYIIRFQNTGTASALNIYIEDTLDNHVDPASFQLLNYSHENLTQIFGNVVRFNFPNINLPDSTTDEPNSHGYVQYRVKTLPGLLPGTSIQNTAYIYFDLNRAVVTNTTNNTVTTNVVTAAPIVKANNLNFALYPNPASNYALATFNQTLSGATLEVDDALGRAVYKETVTGTEVKLNTGSYQSGIYFVKVTTSEGNTGLKKLVVK